MERLCHRSCTTTVFVCATVLATIDIAWSQAIPKQGPIDVTFTAVGRDVKEIPVGSDNAVYLFEATMAFTNNSKTPLMQNVTARCVEAGFSAAGANGYCVFTDKDGDNFVETFSHGAGTIAGKAVLGQGTGKYKGIKGELDWQQVLSLPAEKGSFNFVGKKTGSYRITAD
ncbi:hypothetical protein AWB75_05312 [Caballeronia catudaia]|uniref:Uncharacterized protein n=1 Tax=Caballeronia catudaia TaxID=1777136 RepID=A0A158CKB6_9BURK|nr:hypothetical protein [Caballeronia catudaia]SAK82813.1 hypothetical protein AWB75_05312 [Caballeronia catudaia]